MTTLIELLFKHAAEPVSVKGPVWVSSAFRKMVMQVICKPKTNS